MAIPSPIGRVAGHGPVAARAEPVVPGTLHDQATRAIVGASSLGIPDAALPENATNLLAYYCTLAKQPDLANRLFRENVRRYPKSSNAEESLAEGLLAVNDTAGAVAAFRQTLVLSQRGDDLNAILSHAFLRQLHR